jgi:hypothetical protein
MCFEKSLFFGVSCAVCLFMGLTQAIADVPPVINHQGRIAVDGAPFSGVGAFRFALVNGATATNLWTNDGSAIGTNSRPDAAVEVSVVNGVYNVGLGDTSLPGMSALSPAVLDGAEVLLSIWFDDGVHGIQYLTPSQTLHSTPYAFRALVAQEVDNVDAARIVSGTLDLARLPQGAGTGLDADTLDGQQASDFMSAGTDDWVNAGGDTMTGPLVINQDVSQPLIEASNALTTAIQGTTAYNFGNALRGIATGAQGRGVYGEAASATNHINYGGYFIARGDQARAVYGVAESEVTMTKYGGYFWAKGGNGTGCRGEASGINGKGVYGYATSEAVGTNYGGYFFAKGTTGRGCYASGNEYDFYAGGSGANYGPFTGAHEARIAPDSPPLQPGMVVCATGSAVLRTDEQGAASLSSTLPEITLAAQPKDPAVFGVFLRESPLDDAHWYAAKEGERFAIVNALGEGRVWVCNANGPVRLGDYITTSAVPGYAQRQDDDLLRSYTLGKVIESVDWENTTEMVTVGNETHAIYLVAVVYTSG